MKLRHDRRAVAALEMALVAPIIAGLLMSVTDMGMALLLQAQITRAVAEAAEYATLAGQSSKPPSTATIEANAKTFAGGVSNSFLGTAVTTVYFNNPISAGTDNAATSKCCPGTTWSCSTSASFTCADGSSPGTYLSISVSYPFNAFFAVDSAIIGKNLTASTVAPLQ
jgi:Flp pilus assembly protein TadG